MQHADILFAYDSHMLGGIVTAQVTSTLHRVSATFDAMSADVTVGTVTSSTCVEQTSSPLFGSLAFGKYARSVVRSQQSRITSILKSVRVSGFSARNGHRVSARKVLVMLLDPSSTSRLTQVAHEAGKIRGDDVQVFVVTSGRQGGQLVHDIVSEPGHVIQLPAFDFSNYAFASDTIVGSICGGVCLFLSVSFFVFVCFCFVLFLAWEGGCKKKKITCVCVHLPHYNKAHSQTLP